MLNENITAQKSFPVDVNELYKAWTEETSLKKWWKPAGRKLRSVEAILENGGTIKYIFEPDGNNNGELLIEGNYETVIPDDKLVYSWNWKLDNIPVKDGEYKLTVEFTSEDNGSKITVTQKTEAEQEGIHPHKEGWDNALADLEKYLLHEKN